MTRAVFAAVAELEAMVTEREAMVAMNRMRAVAGMAPAYGEDAFLALAARMRAVVQTGAPAGADKSTNKEA